MNRLSLAAASLLGLAGFAAPARADDIHIDFGFGFRDGRTHGGFFGVGVETPVRFTPRPRVIVDPAPFYPGFHAYPARRADPTIVVDPAPWARDGGRGRDDCEPRQEFIPAHLECRPETICEPAVYEDRCIPVFEDRCVPVYEEVCVPLYEDRRVPITEWVIDARTGRRHMIVIGMRNERVKVGDRTERVKVGDRHEQVQVGTRMERVLVRAEVTRVVNHEEWVPGRYVTVAPDARDRHERARYEADAEPTPRIARR